MKRLLCFFLCLCCLLSAAACGGEDVSGELPVSSAGPSSAEPSAPAPPPESQTDPLEAVRHAAVFLLGESTVQIGGAPHTLEVPPFLEGGVLYVPVAPVAVILGGSFVRSDGVYYMNYQGNVSVMMEEYNVLLFNSDAVIMDRTPVVKEGEFCLPVESLAKILSMSCSKSPSQEIYVLGASQQLDEGALAAVRASLGADILPKKENRRLLELADRCGAAYEELEQYAVYRTLWASDAEGVISSLWLDAAGELHSEVYEMSETFPADSLFVTQKTKGGDKLCDLSTRKAVSEPPDQLYTEELRRATGRYMELLAAASIAGDGRAQSLLAGYRRALSGALDDPDYTADLAASYDTGLYTAQSPEDAWENLFAQAQVGDFLTFSAEGAAAEYGYFNHSALIIEKNETEGWLRLLQARGSEYGVGADLDMDYLSLDSLDSEEYFRKYGVIFLCGAGELSPTQRQEMAENAYEKYNGYQFGYGGRMGLEETNCTELIDEAYLTAGVDLIDGDYESRLKEVLKGNTKNLVLIPDDLLFSEKTRVIAVWKR